MSDHKNNKNEFAEPENTLTNLSREMVENVVAAQKGNEDAFARLMEETEDKVYRFFIFTCENEALAQDLAQDTFIRAMEKITLLKEPKKFKGWLMRLARNIFLDHIKSPKNSRSVAIEDMSTVTQEAESPDTILQVRKSLQRLAPEARLIITLVDLEGHSYSEAAEVMGITESALRSRLHRARKEFVEVYEEK